MVETIAKDLLLLRRWDGPARPTMFRNMLECGTANLPLRQLLRVVKAGYYLGENQIRGADAFVVIWSRNENRDFALTTW